MSTPKTFEDFAAWQAARELTNEVYALCRHAPISRDFGLVDQLRRAAVSVMNNIAEGGETFHVAEKIQFYNFARRSWGEVRSLNYVLIDHHDVSAAKHTAFGERCVRHGRLVSGLMRFLNQS